jgi:hypothetical protein
MEKGEQEIERKKKKIYDHFTHHSQFYIHFCQSFDHSLLDGLHKPYLYFHIESKHKIVSMMIFSNQLK